MSAAPAAPTTLRQRVEHVSRPALLRLHKMPPMLIPLATVALIAVGVLAPVAVGLVALAVIFLFIAWIAYVSWPAVTTSGRVLRLTMLALIVLVALSRL